MIIKELLIDIKVLLIISIVTVSVIGFFMGILKMKEKFIDWLNKDENEYKGDKK